MSWVVPAVVQPPHPKPTFIAMAAPPIKPPTPYLMFAARSGFIAQPPLTLLVVLSLLMPERSWARGSRGVYWTLVQCSCVLVPSWGTTVNALISGQPLPADRSDRSLRCHEHVNPWGGVLEEFALWSWILP